MGVHMDIGFLIFVGVFALVMFAIAYIAITQKND